MYTTVNEASKMIAPLSNTATDLVWKIVSKAYSLIDILNARNEKKELMKIAEALKGEYPFESVEYVAFIIKNEYGI